MSCDACGVVWRVGISTMRQHSICSFLLFEFLWLYFFHLFFNNNILINIENHKRSVVFPWSLYNESIVMTIFDQL